MNESRGRVGLPAVRGILFFSLVIAAPLVAQEPGPSPTSQVQLRLASGTECTTVMRYPSLEKLMAAPGAAKIAPPPSVIKRVLTYNGKDACMVSTFSDGTTRSEFIRGKFHFVLDSKKGEEIFERGSEDDPGGPDFRKVHFPELKWVDEADNRGIRKVEGKEYLIYEQNGASPTQTRRLYVDPVTLLPVSFQSYHKFFTYTYTSLPAGGEIPLPEPLRKSWEKIRSDYKRYFKKEISE